MPSSWMGIGRRSRDRGRSRDEPGRFGCPWRERERDRAVFIMKGGWMAGWMDGRSVLYIAIWTEAYSWPCMGSGRGARACPGTDGRTDGAIWCDGSRGWRDLTISLDPYPSTLLLLGFSLITSTTPPLHDACPTSRPRLTALDRYVKVQAHARTTSSPAAAAAVDGYSHDPVSDRGIVPLPPPFPPPLISLPGHTARP
jgi:hypothetical protein